MTADEFGTVDIDLLADYIGDALDGPEQERVARLVADDPEWRSAYALLSPAMGSVSAELGALGAAAEPMPDHLWVRLNDAFTMPATATDDAPTDHPADASTGRADATTDGAPIASVVGSPVAEPSMIDPALAAPTEPHLAPVRGDRHLVSVPTNGSDRKPTPRRRRLRWAAPIAAAAGVVAFAGLGATYLSNTNSADDSAASSAAGAAQVPLDAPEDQAGSGNGPLAGLSGVAGLTADRIAATGTDYSERSLRAATSAPAPDPMIATEQSSAADKRQTDEKQEARQGDASVLSAGDPALDRLRARAALTACLDAITIENAGGPITVQSIDFARFAGAPALIVRFTANGVAQAWATGPDCGASGRGAQARSRVRVG